MNNLTATTHAQTKRRSPTCIHAHRHTSPDYASISLNNSYDCQELPDTQEGFSLAGPYRITSCLSPARIPERGGGISAGGRVSGCAFFAMVATQDHMHRQRGGYLRLYTNTLWCDVGIHDPVPVPQQRFPHPLYQRRYVRYHISP